MAQLPKNIDVSKLCYSELRTLVSGAKTVYVNYGSTKLTIQTPVLSLPYGLGEPYEAKDTAKVANVTNIEKDKKYDLTMSFRGMDENPKIKSFYDKMKEIETKIVDDVFENRLAWFKDDFDGNKAFLSKLFSPIIKVDKDPNTKKPLGKYPPTFKAKLPYDNKTNNFTFDAYDMENNELDFNLIKNKLKGTKTQLIIQLVGIWFANNTYGCSWKIISGKFQLLQNTKITFIDDSDIENVNEEDEEDEEDVLNSDLLKEVDSKPELKQETKSKVVENHINDEESEEESEEEIVQQPLPKKKNTKVEDKKDKKSKK